jgi:hypothetical protein
MLSDEQGTSLEDADWRKITGVQTASYIIVFISKNNYKLNTIH